MEKQKPKLAVENVSWAIKGNKKILEGQFPLHTSKQRNESFSDFTFWRSIVNDLQKKTVKTYLKAKASMTDVWKDADLTSVKSKDLPEKPKTLVMILEQLETVRGQVKGLV